MKISKYALATFLAISAQTFYGSMMPSPMVEGMLAAQAAQRQKMAHLYTDPNAVKGALSTIDEEITRYVQLEYSDYRLERIQDLAEEAENLVEQLKNSPEADDMSFESLDAQVAGIKSKVEALGRSRFNTVK